MKTLLRIVVIGAILLILVFLSIGIVKVVPKALSSLASATVSIGSLFGENGTATSTNANGVNATGANNGTSAQNNSGFIIVGSSTNSTVNANGSPASSNKTGTSTSILDLITPKFGSYPYNNYVPTPAGQSTSTKSQNTNSNSNSSNGSGNTSTNSTRVASRTCTAGEQPDLVISILSRGIINANGQYIETNNFTTGDSVSIKFKIENRGSCSTGTWNFKAEMPSTNSADQLRTVTNVGSLPAGTAITGQANFDSPQAGNSNVILTVTDNSGRDSDTSDNVATSALVVSNTGTNGVINGGNNGNNGGVPTSGDGRPDLTVKILQTGVLSANNQFIPTTTLNGANGAFGGNFRSGDRVAVQFEVDNQGLSATGPWNFQAQLTDSPTKFYNNPQYEASIAPGGQVIYTIAFDNVRIGSDAISIFVDNLNQVNEFNEGNNTASVNFNVSY
jgi:hypothetical protein